MTDESINNGFFVAMLIQDILIDQLNKKYKMLADENGIPEDNPGLHDGYKKTLRGIKDLCILIKEKIENDNS